VNWSQLGMQALIIVLPLLGGLYIAYKRLTWVLTEYRPHTHLEKQGGLTVDGIRYPRANEK